MGSVLEDPLNRRDLPVTLIERALACEGLCCEQPLCQSVTAPCASLLPRPAAPQPSRSQRSDATRAANFPVTREACSYLGSRAAARKCRLQPVSGAATTSTKHQRAEPGLLSADHRACCAGRLDAALLTSEGSLRLYAAALQTFCSTQACSCWSSSQKVSMLVCPALLSLPIHCLHKP